MRPDKLDGILRTLSARPTRDAAAGRSKLEAELLSRPEINTSRERGFIMTALYRKPIVAFVLVALLAVGACTVSTETEVEMGQRLTYTLESSKSMEGIGELVQFVEKQPGVEEVSINMNKTKDGTVVVDLAVWGPGLDPDGLADRIAGTFPGIAEGKLETSDLSTEVKTSFAEKIGHEFFQFDIVAEGTDNEIKAQILETIYESGFEGLADVDVTTTDGVTKIDLEMTHEGDGVETEDEVIIELIRESD